VCDVIVVAKTKAPKEQREAPGKQHYDRREAFWMRRMKVPAATESTIV